ncbi:MAG: TraB/GumN family protein [Kangiellaceae bacterium]|nr:TraB/GumN family protein [Kangiellaceae bacterium]
MLWRIKETPHKVIGSVHFLPDGTAMPTWVQKSCEGIERIIFEADHTDPSVNEAGVDISGKHLVYPGAEGIYSRAESLLKSVGVDEPFDGLRPWKATFFVMAMLMQKNGISFSNGVEALLHNYSKDKGLEVGYLEAPCRGFDVFESCGEPYDCLRFFEHLIDNIHTSRTELFDIFNAWKTSNVTKLAEILDEKLKIFPDIFNQLVFQRNKEWGPVAVKFMVDRTPTLFVVGALHCVGENSFLKNLSLYGFEADYEK